MAVALDLPTRSWVPRWLGIVTMFVVILPATMLNGAYVGSSVDVSGTLGILSEDITMAYYSVSAGMAVAYPIVPKVRACITPKTLILSDLVLQFVLSMICARAQNAGTLMACSFLIGFLKAFLMLEFIVRMKPFFSPGNIRSQFYAYFYPLVFSGGQLSTALTAELAYRYQWQHMYIFMMILLLVAMVFVLAFFRYAEKPLSIPWREMDFRSMGVAAAALLSLMYFLNYGKYLDWFSSPVMRHLAFLAPALAAVFLWGQKNVQKPYVSLEPLGRRKGVTGYVYMVAAMVFSGSSTLVSSFLSNVLRCSTVQTNSLNLWSLPGFVAGAVICYWWFRLKRWRFRRLVAMGMGCFAGYFAVIYFGVSPHSTYEMFFLPVILKGMGMMIVFIAFGVYVVEDLAPGLMMSNAFFLISLRSVLAPVGAYALYGNLMYLMQTRSLDALASSVTMSDIPAAGEYARSFGSALASGRGTEEAALLATQGLYSQLQTQAFISATKELAGIMLAVSLAIAVVSFFTPFHKTLRVADARTGEDMV